MSQYNFFGTRSYILSTIPEFYILSTGSGSAFCKYALPTNGGSAIRETGLIASSSTIPTIDNFNNKKILASRILPIQIGAYYVGSLSGLIPSTTYFIRAYAINEAGVVYSGYSTTTTSSGVGIPSVSMTSITNISESQADWTGSATNSGGGTISEKGFCWNTTGSPTKLDNYTVVGAGNGSFNYTKTGLSANTTYYVTAYAVNEAGISYSSHYEFKTLSAFNVYSSITPVCNTRVNVNIGIIENGNTVTDSYLKYGISNTNENTITLGAIGNTTYLLTELNANTAYKYRIDVDLLVGSGTTGELTFTTPNYTLPTVSTNSVSNISANMADLYGSVLSTGGTSVVAGFVVNTTLNPSLLDSPSYDVFSGNSTGNFSSIGTWPLSPNTLYHFRAFATNCLGTSYGTDISFVTTNTGGVPPTYDFTGANFTSGSENIPPTIISQSFDTRLDFYFRNYIGSAYKYLVIESINNNYDGDGYNFLSLKYNGSEITSFPFSIDISAMTQYSNTGITFSILDPNGDFLLDIPVQNLSITGHITDINGLSGSSKTAIFAIGYSLRKLVSITNLASTSATVTCSGYGTDISNKGVLYGTISPVNPSGSKVMSGISTYGNYSVNLTGLLPNTQYYISPYIIFAGGNGDYVYPYLGSFTTLP